MTREELELFIKLAKSLEPEKSIVEKGSDLAVEIIESPFKIAGKLLDDLFG